MTSPAARSAPPAPWLTDSERRPAALTLADGLVRAVDLFQADPGLRLLPVVDERHAPIGAIFEKNVRRLLLNPFGHALLRNPAYGRSLAPHLRACPTADARLDIAALIDAYRSADGCEGMILTLDGRLHAVVGNARLVHLAAERELQAARVRVARAQRIEQASERFERQVAELAGGMNALALALETHSGEATRRASANGERAAAVAAAAAQTSQSMGEIAARGRELAMAFARIGGNTRAAHDSAAGAAALVATGSARARELLRSAESIDAVIGLISDIARRVNLLALNATIEAARAGETGRGFTVVANEIKQLSHQTGEAAKRITAHVREILHGVDEVAAGHAEVETSIEAMAALSSEIQASVRAQEAATCEIARNVEESVEAGADIRREVEAIGGNARTASDSAREMAALAGRLLQGASALSRETEAFLGDIRAA